MNLHPTDRSFFTKYLGLEDTEPLERLFAEWRGFTVRFIQDLLRLALAYHRAGSPDALQVSRFNRPLRDPGQPRVMLLRCAQPLFGGAHSDGVPSNEPVLLQEVCYHYIRTLATAEGPGASPMSDTPYSAPAACCECLHRYATLRPRRTAVLDKWSAIKPDSLPILGALADALSQVSVYLSMGSVFNPMLHLLLTNRDTESWRLFRDICLATWMCLTEYRRRARTASCVHASCGICRPGRALVVEPAHHLVTAYTGPHTLLLDHPKRPISFNTDACQECTRETPYLPQITWLGLKYDWLTLSPIAVFEQAIWPWMKSWPHTLVSPPLATRYSWLMLRESLPYDRVLSHVWPLRLLHCEAPKDFETGLRSAQRDPWLAGLPARIARLSRGRVLTK